MSISKTQFIKTFGEGFTGAKAEELIRKQHELNRIGFRIPSTFVYPQNFIDGLIKFNGLGSSLTDIRINKDICSNILKAKPTDELGQDILLSLDQFKKLFGNVPVVIRASGSKDSRGTDTYRTLFVRNNFEESFMAFKNIIAGYLTEEAALFRKDANLGEGLGIMMHPMISRIIKEVNMTKYYAPGLSGFGYSKDSEDESEISLDPFLGGGVTSLHCETISNIDFMKKDYETLGDYLDKTRQEEILYHAGTGIRASNLLQTRDKRQYSSHYDDRLFWKNCYYGKYFADDNKTGQIGEDYIVMDPMVEKAMKKIKLYPIFEKMDQLWDVFGKKQYFEIAIDFDHRWNPMLNITQISDVEKKILVNPYMPEVDPFRVLFCARDVHGSGIKECNKMAYCWNPEEIPQLKEFNKNNKDYLLILRSDFLSENRDKGPSVNYSHYSNACVILGWGQAPGSKGFYEHFKGESEMTNKIIAVLDRSRSNTNIFENKGQLPVLDIKTKVFANQKEDWLVAIRQD